MMEGVLLDGTISLIDQSHVHSGVQIGGKTEHILLGRFLNQQRYYVTTHIKT